ncbi:unnamed protein product [Mycena citricolor]|uniref:Uncharacterized protein n=1 Tax=Mycena citricolor TaxID=2018698 RepID=A0AAD2Q6S0_9AGAR|nr:unnamed protein product [Mycena citricolor]
MLSRVRTRQKCSTDCASGLELIEASYVLGVLFRSIYPRKAID